jgi:hypothetical protein
MTLTKIQRPHSYQLRAAIIYARFVLLTQSNLLIKGEINDR